MAAGGRIDFFNRAWSGHSDRVHHGALHHVNWHGVTRATWQKGGGGVGGWRGILRKAMGTPSAKVKHYSYVMGLLFPRVSRAAETESVQSDTFESVSPCVENMRKILSDSDSEDESLTKVPFRD